MCSSWTAEPLVVDMQYHDEIHPCHATLEVAPGFGMASWQSPMSSFTFQCACETSVGSGPYAVQNLEQECSTWAH